MKALLTRWAPRAMPVAVCQVGSGLLALTIMGTGAGMIGGAFWLAISHEKAQAALIHAQKAAGTWVPPPPAAPDPEWMLYVPYVLLGALLLMVWWFFLQALYAHCLRFWHPEIAPPRTVACPTCTATRCPTCKGTRWAKEPVATTAVRS